MIRWILEALHLTPAKRTGEIEQIKDDTARALVTLEDEKNTALNAVAAVHDELQAVLLLHQAENARTLVSKK